MLRKPIHFYEVIFTPQFYIFENESILLMNVRKSAKLSSRKSEEKKKLFILKNEECHLARVIRHG